MYISKNEILIEIIERKGLPIAVFKDAFTQNWRQFALLAAAMLIGNSAIGEAVVGEWAGLSFALLSAAFCPVAYCAARLWNRQGWLVPWAEMAIMAIVLSGLDFAIHGEWQLLMAAGLWLSSTLGLLFLFAKRHKEEAIRWHSYAAYCAVGSTFWWVIQMLPLI